MSEIQNFWPDWHQTEVVGSGSSGRVFSIVRSDGQREKSAIMKVIETQDDPAAVEQRVKSVMALRFGPNMLGLDAYHLEPTDGQKPTTLYMRSEYMPSLEQMGLPKQEEAVRLGIEISSALSFCEEHGMIHGNIKPSNIFLSQYGSFKLGDFMIARGISGIDQNAIRTSVRYQAPEILSGMSFSYNADLYSLGLILYRCLNHGRFPYEPSFTLPLQEQDSISADSSRNGGAQLPVPDDCDRSLGEIILRTLQWSPMNRYASAAALRSDLIAWQNGRRTISAFIPAQQQAYENPQSRENGKAQAPEDQTQSSGSMDQTVKDPEQSADSTDQSLEDPGQSAGSPEQRFDNPVSQETDSMTDQSASVQNAAFAAGQADSFLDDEEDNPVGDDISSGNVAEPDDSHRTSESRRKSDSRKKTSGSGRKSGANPLVIVLGIAAAAVICGVLFYFFLII